MGIIDAGRGRDPPMPGAGGADYIDLGRDADELILRPKTDTGHRITVNGGGNVSTPQDSDSDLVSFAVLSADVTVDLDTGRADSTQGRLMLREIEHIQGGAGRDVIRGDDQANQLRGGAGADTLDGWGGQDRPSGGRSADRFAFAGASHTARSRADLITDFSRAEGDRIDLSEIGDDVDLPFIGTAAFSGRAGELRSTIQGSITLVAADLNGDRLADLQIQLTGRLTLAAGDFILDS